MRIKNLQEQLDKMKPKRGACDHGEDMWCDRCVNFPALTEIRLPDGTVTHGRIISNIPNAAEIIKDGIESLPTEPPHAQIPHPQGSEDEAIEAREGVWIAPSQDRTMFRGIHIQSSRGGAGRKL